jgi:response regulator RpfG family c-di-GMP phosphodiesterase
MKHKVLIVDDEPAITRTLERLFREDFEVVTACSGSEGLSALATHDIALIVSDQRMPGMTGVEFLKLAADLRPHCVRIILTGYTDAGDLVDAINSGVVYKYVTKPWENGDLMQTVKRGLSHHETMKAQHRLNLENTRLHERVKSSDRSVMNLCSAILKIKNLRMYERAERVRDMSMLLGNAMMLDAVVIETLSISASLFGIADLYVPRSHFGNDSVKESYATLRNQAREQGLELLDDLPTLEEVVVNIRYLAESFDGTGTPAGLCGVQIPLVSRILAVVKAFDEMIFPDTSAIALTSADALDNLRGASGFRFDPDIVHAFCGLMEISDNQNILPALHLGLRSDQRLAPLNG